MQPQKGYLHQLILFFTLKQYLANKENFLSCGWHKDAWSVDGSTLCGDSEGRMKVRFGLHEPELVNPIRAPYCGRVSNGRGSNLQLAEFIPLLLFWPWHWMHTYWARFSRVSTLHVLLHFPSRPPSILCVPSCLWHYPSITLALLSSSDLKFSHTITYIARPFALLY